MSRMGEVLSRIENVTTIRSIVRELDMNRSRLLAMIEFLVDGQYLEMVDMQWLLLDLESMRTVPVPRR